MKCTLPTRFLPDGLRTNRRRVIRKAVAVCVALMLGLYGGHAVLGAQRSHSISPMASGQPDSTCTPAAALLLPRPGKTLARPAGCLLTDEAAPTQDALVDTLGAADRFE